MQAHGTLEFSGGGGIPGPGTIPLTSLAPQAAGTVVANNTGGAASPTAVPYASMPWVLKAGDTMTGALSVNLNGGALETPTFSAGLQVSGVDATNTAVEVDVYGAAPIFYSRRSGGTRSAKTALALDDSIGLYRGAGWNGSAYVFGGQIAIVANEAYSGVANGTRIQFQTTPIGATAAQISMRLGSGLYMLSATGGDQGTGTVNATALYENGVSLTAKYLALAGGTLTGPAVIAYTETGATQQLIIQNNDPGATGAYLRYFHNSASPAVLDNITAVEYRGNNSAAAAVNYASYQVQILDPTAAAESSQFNFRTRLAGTIADRFRIGAGVYTATATGSDQGAGTINATALYANGNLVADTNGLLRTRAYTVGTLPAAAGVAGALARVSDALAAPVYNAAAAGGGTVFANVCSNGTTWLYC